MSTDEGSTPAIPGGEREASGDRPPLVFYNRLLEALRHREQEVLRFWAIVGPALAGYAWLLFGKEEPIQPGTEAYWMLTVATILLVFLGACYALAIGYHYRALREQLRKLEGQRFLDAQYVLAKWRTSFKGNSCWPPEVVLVFFTASVLLMPLLALFSIVLALPTRQTAWPGPCLTVFAAASCMFLALWVIPRHYADKLKDIVAEEQKEIQGDQPEPS